MRLAHMPSPSCPLRASAASPSTAKVISIPLPATPLSPNTPARLPRASHSPIQSTAPAAIRCRRSNSKMMAMRRWPSRVTAPLRISTWVERATPARPALLPQAQAVLLSAQFAPTAVGALSGTASIVDNTLGVAGTSQNIPLSGVGTQATPAITWPTPAAITYGVALSGTQLNASSTVAGTFSYSPAGGVLTVGSHLLS